MNIYDALVLARSSKKALRRKRWLIKNPPETCVYHAIDNTFRWFKNDPSLNGSNYTFSIKDLLAVDWEVVDHCHYNGSRYQLDEEIREDGMGKKKPKIKKT